MVRPAPRERRDPSVLVPSASLVASAVRYAGGKVPRIHNPTSTEWQHECYRHYAICGEARFAADFFGHALSRTTLHAQTMQEGALKRTTTGDVADLLEDLFNGRDGQAQMLKAIGTHLTIAGECYLVGRDEHVFDDGGNPTGEETIWEIVSVVEMKVNGQRWSIDYGVGAATIDLTDDDVVIRIWNPSPAKRMEADSPFRSLLPILAEIEWLTREIFGQLTSRLAGNGILLLPQGMTFPPPASTNDGDDGPDLTNEANAFMLTLAEAMMDPIKNPESPAALVPIVVTAPADLIDKVQHLTLWDDIKTESMQLREEAIRRFAVGMDLPAEQVLGMSSNNGTGGGNSNGVSHWGAWQIEEATIKMHVEPMLELVVNALTIGYIRPLVPETKDSIGYDSSALRLRPDRSRESMELYQMGALKQEVMLRENGFDVTDMPDPEEFKRWVLTKIASGSATPEQVEAGLAALGIELNSQRFAAPGYAPTETRETPQPPSLEDHPSRPRTPGEDQPFPEAAALYAACDSLVYRALEKAGNKVLNAGKRGKDRDRTVDPVRAHCHSQVNGTGPSLLADAFTYAPRVLDGIADPDVIVPALKQYVLGLFAEQQPHTRERMREALQEVAAR